ncbi:MAG: hypothetical protein IJU45_03245 [Clostridia bacterium]|nr:hypothetical protein [Clostridia bacterium]
MDRPITDLCYDYFDAAAKMDFLIKKCTKELKEATKAHQYKKCYYLKRKRIVYYSQKRELMETAYRLQNYYRKEDAKIEHYCA